MKALEKTSPRRSASIFDRFGLTSALPDVLDAFWRDQWLPDSQEWSPRMDVIENKKNIIVKADLPGIDEKKLSVEVKNGVLILSGHREEEKEYKEGEVSRVERFIGSFTRTMSLPDNIDDSKIDASYKKGVLTVTLPKTKESTPRKITVKVG